MSIASEFDSTIENIKSDYEGLENIGADLTNVNKNIQNIRTCLDNIYTNLPKTTGEGSNLSLTTLKGRINVDDILGDTEQDTYEGYNLLPNYRPSTQTLNQMKQTKNDDGSIIFNGTTNAYTQFVDSNSITLPSGSYSLFVKTDNASNYVTGQIRSADGLTTITTTSTRSTFTLTEATEVKYRTVITSGTTLSNYELKPMVYSGTTAKTWEPYTNGASPNPTYPQDIEVVRGKNRAKLEAEGKYRVFSTGNFATNANFNSYIADVQPMTAYITSAKNIATQYAEISNLCYFDKNMNYISGIAYNTADKSFTTPNNCYYVTMAVNVSIEEVQTEKGSQATSYLPYNTQEVVVQNANILDTSEIKVVKNQTGDNRNGYYCKINTTGTYTLILNTTNTMYFGKSTNLESATTLIGSTSATYTTNYTFNEGEYFIIWGTKTDTDKLMVALGTSLPYIEHQEQTKTLHLGDIELSKIGTYQDRIFETSGKNLFDSLIELGSYDNTTGLPANNGSAVRTKTPVEVTPNTTYTLSNNLDYHPFIYEYGESDNFIQYTRYDVTTATFTTSATTKYIRVRTNATNVENKTSVLFMLNEGSTALPYEPYGSDKWYIEKNIKKLILNGSEGWNTARSTSPYIYVINVPNYMRTNELVCMSNYFKGVANGTYGSMTNNEIKFRYYTDTSKDMYICSSNFTTLADFKTWLGTHNTEVRYVLDTPTYTEITNETLLNELNELEKMMSYNGQTNISVSGNLPMILDISALKGE